jgi:trehalose 6-phosphate synthase/phosphatase
MSRLIIISNRLPFSIDKDGERMTLRQSSGGLVSAIKSYFEREQGYSLGYTHKIWVGSMDSSVEDWENVQKQGTLNEDFEIIPLFPPKETYDDFYNGFSNSTLWPLFHYFPSLVENKKEYFEAYRKINQLFANKILEFVEPGDVIWVHDYQLMLLPQMLREKLPDAAIG